MDILEKIERHFEKQEQVDEGFKEIITYGVGFLQNGFYIVNKIKIIAKLKDVLKYGNELLRSLMKNDNDTANKVFFEFNKNVEDLGFYLRKLTKK